MTPEFLKNKTKKNQKIPWKQYEHEGQSKKYSWQ